MTKKPRILHLLASQRFSGAENVAVSILEGLRRDADFLYVSSEGPVKAVLESRDIPHRLVSSFSRREISKVIRDFRPDLIHAHDYRASLIAATLKGPKISHLHNNVPWSKKCNVGTAMYLAASAAFSKILAVSSSVIREQFFHDILARKSQVLPNAVDRSMTRRKSLEAVAEQVDLVFVGRLAEQKDPLRFIKLAKILKGFRPDLKAVMIGEGELEALCRSEIELAGLSENVSMAGFQENPYPQIAAGKICLMPSRWEGFGLVALEAISLGVPTLGTPVGGLEDILKPKFPELLCRDDDQFVEQSLRLLNSDSARREVAKKGSLEFDQRFSSKRFLEDLSGVYAEVLHA